MKVVKPKNLNLEDLIDDNLLYSYKKNLQGKLTVVMKKGSAYRKLIPYMYVVINEIIITDKETKPWKKNYSKISNFQFNHYMTTKKLYQVCHFLENQGIIKIEKYSERIHTKKVTYSVEKRHYKLNSNYNTDFEIIDVDVELNKKVTYNIQTLDIIKSDAYYKHLFEKVTHYIYNYDSAFAFIHEQNYTDIQLVYRLQYIEKLKNNLRVFSYSISTNRIFTIINQCPKELRQFFLTPNGKKYIEIDISATNVNILIFMIDRCAKNNQINDLQEVLNERNIIVSQKDFYSLIVSYFKENGITIDRDTAKDYVLKYWINNKYNNNKTYKVFKSLFPAISTFIETQKGKNYEQYLNYSNQFMKIESKIIRDVYTVFHKDYPNVSKYTIHDGIMVEEEYSDILLNVFKSKLHQIFNREIKINKK